jgi:hypothetical protein
MYLALRDQKFRTSIEIKHRRTMRAQLQTSFPLDRKRSPLNNLSDQHNGSLRSLLHLHRFIKKLSASPPETI